MLATRFNSISLSTYGARNVDLGYVRWQHARNLRNRSNFQRRSNDNDQVHFVPIMMKETMPKFIGEVFSKECDIRLIEGS